jgi:pimeloyl-ACP methyl ester carboxylesterase
VPIGPFGLAYILRIDVGDATDLPVFPRLLWSIDQGDPSILAWFVRKRAGIATGVHGMSEVMDAASGASPARFALIAEQSKTSRFANVVNFPYPYARVGFDGPDLGEVFRAPLVSPVRTLIVSGEYDFNTPPSQGEELRWGLPNATHLVVLHAGHEQTLFQNDTVMPVLLDFLKGIDVSERTISYPPLRFVPLEGSDPNVRHPSVPR